MKEELYYVKIDNCSHFVHEHRPNEIKRIPFIFLNPIFDEKKRSQKFYAETAREFCKQGIPVIRFDYYGTGDSEGQLYEMNFNEISSVVNILIEEVLKKYKSQKVDLLGLRIGADIAIKVTENYSKKINDLILIEPVVIGKRYLTEQRSRRRIFHKINNMINVQDEIIINGKKYEDHQGYPISKDNVEYLNELDSTELNFINKNILIVKLDTISSRKTINGLRNKLEQESKVTFVSYSCEDFWASLIPINTNKFTRELIIHFTNSNS